MAFVFNQPRFEDNKENITPGPGFYQNEEPILTKKVNTRPSTIHRKIKKYQSPSFEPFYFKNPTKKDF